MNYIKNNSIFLAILFIAITIFISLLLFSVRYSEETELLIINIKQSQKDIDKHRNKILPFLGLDYEITNARRDLDKLALIEREQNRLWKTVLSAENNIAINWTPKDTDSINSILIRQYTQLRKLSRVKNIALPGKTMFLFLHNFLN